MSGTGCLEYWTLQVSGRPCDRGVLIFYAISIIIAARRTRPDWKLEKRLDTRKDDTRTLSCAVLLRVPEIIRRVYREQ